jgi:hypothetical protein
MSKTLINGSDGAMPPSSYSLMDWAYATIFEGLCDEEEFYLETVNSFWAGCPKEKGAYLVYLAFLSWSQAERNSEIYFDLGVAEFEGVPVEALEAVLHCYAFELGELEKDGDCSLFAGGFFDCLRKERPSLFSQDYEFDVHDDLCFDTDWMMASSWWSLLGDSLKNVPPSQCSKGMLRDLMRDQFSPLIPREAVSAPKKRGKQADKPKTATKGFVYLMRNNRNGYHKIGASKKPAVRERTLQSEDPDISLLVAKEFPDMFKRERELHREFKEKRLRGEWFDLADEEIETVLEALGSREAVEAQ